ncbi:hypothetical protein FACS189428_0610 [Clostridia bacterium]|nr:hypothetical protein FACS189428_0610 [Clostridia bacterium]
MDKYFGEFSNVVKVDTVQISSGYTATSGSTNITLESNYLNTLSTGNHTLTVGFDGGVRVSDTFTILPVPVTPPVTPPNTPSGDGGGGGSASKDNCPNGDFSASYYDGECGTNPSDSTSHLADTSAENATNGDTSTSNSVAP